MDNCIHCMCMLCHVFCMMCNVYDYVWNVWNILRCIQILWLRFFCWKNTFTASSKLKKTWNRSKAQIKICYAYDDQHNDETSREKIKLQTNKRQLCPLNLTLYDYLPLFFCFSIIFLLLHRFMKKKKTLGNYWKKKMDHTMSKK